MRIEILLPGLPLRLPHQLGKAAYVEFADTRDHASRGSHVEVRSEDRPTAAREGNPAPVAADGSDTEGAELALDQWLEPGRCDREQVEAVAPRLSRRDSRLRP